jgi:acyl carrier protein
LALRQYLKQKLPEYMVPAVIVLLMELPLGTTGKVDRQALPAVAAGRPELETKYLAPRTAVEEDLARIWREVLAVQHIGIEDNFFELGGHSLMATQVLSRVREVFNLEVPLRVMFQSPTIASFAIAIVQLRMDQLDSEQAALVLDELEALSTSEAKRLLAESPTWTTALTKH